MFCQTANLYYDNIRPQTPTKFKDQKYLKKLEEQEKLEQQEMAKTTRVKFKDQIATNYSPSVSPVNDKTAKQIQSNELSSFAIHMKESQIKLPSTGSLIQSNRAFSLSKLHTHKQHNNCKQNHFHGAGEKINNSIMRKTFNQKIRSCANDGKILEFQYFKEKKLLEFLSLKGKKNDKIQKEIRQKLTDLVKKNKFIEDERNNLMTKLNDFNPLNTKAISKYLEQTEVNNVSTYFL